MKNINLRVFPQFFASQSSGGILLFLCVVISLIIANSSLGVSFERILNSEIGIKNGALDLRYSVLLWINDGLMAIFFLFVGLEIKRELVEGELSSVKKASLPIFAALGGFGVPAFIYFIANKGTATASGWGIPMATDIAFALAVLAVLRSRLPPSLKIFLSALAIVDDLAAIIVIAIFYAGNIDINYLAGGVGIFLLLMAFNRLGLRNLAFYLIPGTVMWYLIHHSGVHATIAGVLTAMAVPTNKVAKISPLETLEHVLMKPVNFIIMPLFALANTNIRFESGMVEGLGTSLGLGIILGLFIGKPLGISLFTLLSVKARMCTLPAGMKWHHVIGIGFLGGIGFTMSIFMAVLSFGDQAHFLSEAKFSILIASLLSGSVGLMILGIKIKPMKSRINKS